MGRRTVSLRSTPLQDSSLKVPAREDKGTRLVMSQSSHFKVYSRDRAETVWKDVRTSQSLRSSVHKAVREDSTAMPKMRVWLRLSSERFDSAEIGPRSMTRVLHRSRCSSEMRAERKVISWM